MNPIYKFQLSAGSATQQAYPIYKDDLAKDFEKESNQQFFRAKLSGKLTFERNDYTFIVSKAFDTQFVLEISISYNAGRAWTSYWRGTFWKTDCEFDNDTQTVIVQPTVIDQYSDVLAGIDKEYNLIDLLPEIVAVIADKRPMIQVYVPGQSVIGCFLSGMWWEQECEPESNVDYLRAHYHFYKERTERVITCSENSFGIEVFIGNAPTDNETEYTLTRGDYAFHYKVTEELVSESVITTTVWEIVRLSDNVAMWRYETNTIPDVPNSVTLAPVSGTGATGNIEVHISDIVIMSRFVCDVEEINGVPTQQIPSDDIVPNNRNYTRVIGYNFPNTISFSTNLSTNPTQWGIYQPGKYYQIPYSIYAKEFFPVARNAWGRVSIWFSFDDLDLTVEQSGRHQFTIRNAFPLSSVISVLLSKIAPGITHAATTAYSQFLYGTNLIGVAQTLLIVPKSNIVSAGYDQPAQKAPITLNDVLTMLRDCFRCYWYIDSQNRFRIEHIQYFQNGGSYSGTPGVGIDLTAQLVSRNQKAWAFARNQYKFDKPAMASRYQFAWMDDVTQLFEGFPIDIISKYVNPENIEQITVHKFTSDIDYILLNPSAVSKDGFALISARYQEGAGNYVYDLDSYPLRNYNIVQSTGKYGTNTTYKHILIPVIAGKTIRVIASSVSGTDARIAWFTSDDAPVAGGTPPYVPGTSLIIQQRNTTVDYVVPSGATYMFVYFSGSPYNFKPQSIIRIDDVATYQIPYYDYVIGVNHHYLQNGLAAFCFLQRYYAYDMPARQYEINGNQMFATGIKKLKNQTLSFPAYTDPDLVQLIKTNLGNGVVEKLSVNLSSRNATVTLKYDTE